MTTVSGGRETYIEDVFTRCGGSHDRDDLAEDYLIVGHAEEHPDQVENIFCCCRGAKVAIADSGQDLKSPIQTLHVLLNCCSVEFIEVAHAGEPFAGHPGVRIEFIKLGGEIPEAGKQMDQEEAAYEKAKHFLLRGLYLYETEYLVESLVVLQTLEHLEDAHQPHESVEPRQPGEPDELVDASASAPLTEGRYDGCEYLSRYGRNEVQIEPPWGAELTIVSRYGGQAGHRLVVGLIGAEEVDDDVDAEENVDQAIERSHHQSVLVDECDLVGHDSRSVEKQQNDDDVPEGLELARRHDDVPSRLLAVGDEPLVGLVRYQLSSKELDLCDDGLLLSEHNRHTDGAAVGRAPETRDLLFPGYRVEREFWMRSVLLLISVR